jgi:hypothetical protein
MDMHASAMAATGAAAASIAKSATNAVIFPGAVIGFS